LIKKSLTMATGQAPVDNKIREGDETMLLAKDEELALDLNRIFHFEDVTERRFLAWKCTLSQPWIIFHKRDALFRCTRQNHRC